MYILLLLVLALSFENLFPSIDTSSAIGFAMNCIHILDLTLNYVSLVSLGK